MSFWVCSGVALLGAGSAALLKKTRRAILGLWMAGLGVGGVYLSLGAEFLAIIQWMMSTLVAITFMFYSVTFGMEEGKTPPKYLIMAISGATTFAIMIGLGMIHFVLNSGGSNFMSIGKTLIGEYFLPLEVLAFLLLMVAIGAGILSRTEGEAKEAKK